MKHFFQWSGAVILAALILFLPSCSNEIDLYPHDLGEQLFIWGCLDGTGDLHQVKIRRAIAGEKDAGEMINDPGYYLPDHRLRVSLSGAGAGPVLFERVLHPRQEGLFSQDSNYIYEIRGFEPRTNNDYTLEIEEPVTGRKTQATIKSLPPVVFTYPVKESVPYGKFSFTNAGRPFQISFIAGPIYVWTISIKYVDVLFSGDTICRKGTFSGVPSAAASTDGHAGKEFPLPYLWNIFNLLIPDDRSVDFRMFYRFDFSAWSGDSGLASYLTVAKRFHDNRKQIFGNIENGIGLFYATNHDALINVCPMDAFAIHLATSDSTKALNFSRFLYPGKYSDPDSLLQNPFTTEFR